MDNLNQFSRKVFLPGLTYESWLPLLLRLFSSLLNSPPPSCSTKFSFTVAPCPTKLISLPAADQVRTSSKQLHHFMQFVVIINDQFCCCQKAWKCCQSVRRLLYSVQYTLHVYILHVYILPTSCDSFLVLKFLSPDSCHFCFNDHVVCSFYHFYDSFTLQSSGISYQVILLWISHISFLISLDPIFYLVELDLL